MIVFDLINDEAPLFVAAIKELPRFKNKPNDFVFITEGNRWKKEVEGLSCRNRLHFFDKLEKEDVNLDEELKRISNEYDNFNMYASDRYLIQKDRFFQKKMLVYTYLFFEDLFSKNVTHYFTTGIAYTYNLISFQVSKKFNVRHVSFYGIRFRNRTAISLDQKNTFNEVRDWYKGFTLGKIKDEMYEPINHFLTRPTQPGYMKNAINSSKLEFVFIKEFFIRFKRYYFSNKHRFDLFSRNPFELSSFKIKKIFNAKRIDFSHKRVFDQVKKEDKYFLFPLHMQPEASTLILAPFYVNQKDCIVNISKLIPPDTYLYVKEHKSALGQHSLKFYKELKRHPNIKVISYRENMFELIHNSLGTINLSSTVGLESLMIKKPTVLLGDVFYNDSGLTFKVDSFKELEKVLNEVNNEGFSLDTTFENYNEKLAFYIDALLKKSYPFEFNVAKMDTKAKVLTPTNIKEFSKCLESLIS
ncbi:hypothetical protein RQM59_01935 [Flavobacteriaceae bacterium S356]|uniref:Capsule polysaccharide biosynthesis protein n=1 Tax=Asprobacillus argus TaxID=3076534 RepID=A0ABU3LCI9_9FLAO|nr:hypothetical protein [Flavobacteriaceae bacterium S356]